MFKVMKVALALSGSKQVTELCLRNVYHLPDVIQEIEEDKRDASKLTLYQVCAYDETPEPPLIIRAYINDECVVSFGGGIYCDQKATELYNDFIQSNLSSCSEYRILENIKIIKIEDRLIAYNSKFRVLIDGILECDNYNNWEENIHWR